MVKFVIVVLGCSILHILKEQFIHTIQFNFEKIAGSIHFEHRDVYHP